MNVHVSRIRIVAIATVMGAFIVAPAQTPNPWGLKLGVTFPANKDVRDVVAKTGFNVGAYYALTNKPLLKAKGPSVVSGDLDYFRLGSGSTHVEALHIGYSERVMFEDNEMGTGVYAGFTAGLGTNKVKVTTYVPPDDGNGDGDGEGDRIGSANRGKNGEPPNSGGGNVSRTEQRIQPFLELLVGFKVQKNLGIEAFYRIIPKFDGVDTSVFGVRAGFKF